MVDSESEDLREPGDRDELVRLMWARAREGSVMATKYLLEETRPDADEDYEPPSGLDALDELAPRRQRRG